MRRVRSYLRAVTLIASLIVAGLFCLAWQQPQKSPPAKVVTGPASNSKPLFITAGYVRMHHPEVLIDLAASVKAGTTPATTLSKLVGSDFATTLTNANLQPLQQANGPQKTTDSGTPPPPRHVEYASVVSPGGPVPVLPGSAYSPHKLGQSDVRTGQTVTASVTFQNVYTGPISANFDNTFGGAAVITHLVTYTGTETLTPNGSYQPVSDQVANNGGPINATAGQECCVFVKFNFPKAGTYTGNLILKGTSSAPWSATIPLDYKVTDLGTSGATASADTPQVNVDSLGDTYQLPITIEPKNYKKPFSLTIQGKSLPKGITVQPLTVNINGGGKVNVALNVKGDQTALDAYGGYAQEAEFEVVPAGGDKTTFKARIDCLRGMIEYQFATLNSGDTTWSAAFLDMSADGDFFYGRTIQSSGDAFYFGVFYPGVGNTGTGSIDAGILTSGGGYGPHSGTSNWIHTHWPQCLISPPATLLFDDGNGQTTYSPELPPYKTITFPTTPPLTITGW